MQVRGDDIRPESGSNRFLRDAPIEGPGAVTNVEDNSLLPTSEREKHGFKRLRDIFCHFHPLLENDRVQFPGRPVQDRAAVSVESMGVDVPGPERSGTGEYLGGTGAERDAGVGVVHHERDAGLLGCGERPLVDGVLRAPVVRDVAVQPDLDPDDDVAVLLDRPHAVVHPYRVQPVALSSRICG